MRARGLNQKRIEAKRLSFMDKVERVQAQRKEKEKRLLNESHMILNSQLEHLKSILGGS